MADHKITDFVEQSAIDGLKRLKEEMLSVKDAYEAVAHALVKGLKVSVDGLDQLEKLTKQTSELQRQAADATQRHSAAINEQTQILNRTTSVISEALQGQTKLNREVRQSKVDYSAVMDAVDKVNGVYEEHLHRILEIDTQTKKNKKTISEYQKLIDAGKDSTGQMSAKVIELTTANRQMAAEKAKLNSLLKAEEREMTAAQGSYTQLSNQLEVMKKSYKEMSAEQREAAEGKQLLESINQLDAELKYMAEDMGEFQRNVGNYAIACSQGSMSVQELSNALTSHAVTVQDCIEQNKALEQAKLSLNKEDANYAETVQMINARIEENKKKILDVDSILQTEAKTVEEAEKQNKQLAEAIKLVDYTTEEGQRKIALYNAKIAENKQAIERATPALQEHGKASEGLVDQMMSLVGVNSKFGSSLQSLSGAAKGGSVIEGLGVKIKAFGQTLMGLLANPWVLTFLGLAGVAAGVKWWYEYNKGLIEATRLTKDFTGKSGDDLKNFRSEVQGVADTFGKDFKDVLNATDKMASQLGISYEEALGAIKDGFIANADAQGNFLSNVEKFSPALRDAGLSAKEMVAIISQTRSGVFSEDGLKAIQVASDRLKRMPNATKEALQALGMSTDEIQRSLTDGTKSMMDVIQEVSGKLKEFPENSEAYGDAIFNVFGRKAAAGGGVLIESLATINTNLDAEKDKLGELGKLQEEQMESQIKLDKTLAAVFDSTGGAFEAMQVSAKTFINNGIVKIIEGCVGIVNWFIRLYNQSMVVRGAFNSISNSFKTIWEVAKFVINQIITGFKAMGDVIEAVLTFDVTNVSESFARIDKAAKKGIEAFKGNIASLMTNVADNTADAFKKTLNDKMSEISLDVSGEYCTEGTSTSGGARNATAHATDADKKAASKEAKQAEKEAKEAAKRLNELEEARLKTMEEGHEKEMATIRLNYMKKVREIVGNSDDEKATKLSLLAAMQKDLDKCEEDYQREKGKVDTANRLAVAKKGSKEELAIKLEQLEASHQAELEQAKKNGADTLLIDRKYEKQKQDLKEEFAAARIKKIEEDFAAETTIADNAYNEQLNKMKAAYVKELKLAGNNESEKEEITRKYENNIARLGETYAQQRAQASIDMLEKVLSTEDLTADERAKLELQLATAKIDLEKSVTDATEAQLKRQVDADKSATEKRIENAQRWLQVASDGLNAINGLASAIFDAQIERIEAEQDANTEAGEAEQERISDLVEKNVITQEEGEARKRAAEAKTAKKEEDLEKKKQEIKHKQAVWDKANSVAQAGIATALAIMNALQMKPFPVGIAMAAIAGAMGAVQIATILATPIPKYAKGTKDHPGGMAIVGDGGRAEIVSYGGQMFLTPDKPTLIDMPRGAEVFPDAERMMASPDFNASLMSDKEPSVVVNNDYSDLKREIIALGGLIKQQTKTQQRSVYKMDYERYKNLRI